jgi:hypothetical protein
MPLERTAATYGPGVTSASRAVLLELMTVLRPYRDALVLVGGWVPYFLLERHRAGDDPFVHVGSIDIDLAVDPAGVSEPQYATIVELLRSRGYRPVTTRRGPPVPAGFERVVQSPVTDKPYTIRVDFLAPLGAPSATRREPPLLVQDGLLARKLKGCDVAFRHQTRLELSGELPDGGRMTASLRMSDVVGCVTMKGIVLGERYREKDAYDLYAVMAHYAGGPGAVAELIRPHLKEPLVQEAIARIREAFATRASHGPAWAASFLVPPMFGEAYQRAVTDAFMVVHEFTTTLTRPASLRPS